MNAATVTGPRSWMRSAIVNLRSAGTAELIAGEQVEPVRAREILGLEKNAHIVNGDLLKQNYSSADLVTVYLLPDAVNPADTLFQNGGIPRDIHINHHGATLEVEDHSSGIRREKDHAIRLFPKARHQVSTLF